MTVTEVKNITDPRTEIIIQTATEQFPLDGKEHLATAEIKKITGANRGRIILEFSESR